MATDAIASIDILKIWRKILFFYFILGYQVIKITTIIVFDTHTIRICLDYPKIISEKWNLAVNFNCQEVKIITLLFAVMSVSGL